MLREVAKDVTPAENKAPTLTKQLAPHKKTLLKFRKEGYSVTQITDFLKQSKLGVSVSPSFLRQFLAPHKTGRKQTASTTRGDKVKYVAMTRPTAGGATTPAASVASKVSAAAPLPTKTT